MALNAFERKRHLLEDEPTLEPIDPRIKQIKQVRVNRLQRLEREKRQHDEQLKVLYKALSDDRSKTAKLSMMHMLMQALCEKKHLSTEVFGKQLRRWMDEILKLKSLPQQDYNAHYAFIEPCIEQKKVCEEAKKAIDEMRIKIEKFNLLEENWYQ
jgi:hypothetical protein